ncbi:unnamed protein product [Clonostachys byssicola]|uniref:Multiple RNA-binding domain-containing protein 1 n=1 Tax=Clonostachys byssicola TaxID=160290 RepID=A0A9N9UG04_9HYPO|nr:unnamed protein product [Clonostachys byssicola]
MANMTSSRIFVKGLPPSITEAEFRKHFSAGNREITDVKLIPQRRIGYVGYKTPEVASKAIKYFNKSYVRMSKISVESARPISDPALHKSQGSGRFDGQSAKRKAPESNIVADPSSKKQKRGEQETADPKLQEFLQVMGKSKEDPMADATNFAGEAGLSKPDVPVPEGESDDEYEEIPSAKDKKRNIANPEMDRNAKQPEGNRNLLNKQEAHSDTQTPRADPPPESEELPPAEAAAPPAPGATDDDWLRSRTNRLLDLVDPDDLDSSIPSHGKDSSPQPGTHPEPQPAQSQVETPDAGDEVAKKADEGEQKTEDVVESIRRTSRLFIRNLPYGSSEDEIRECFERFGPIQEVHIPVSKAGSSKGYALVLFVESSHAVEAFQAMDGSTFQGRLIHIIPADAKRDAGLNEWEISKLPLKKQNMIRKKAEASSSTFNWNSLFMSQDAVNASVASRLGVSKSELLDPTSADAGVKQAIAETTVIQETKAYFVANGVDLGAFKSQKRGDTAILVKNFPYGTTMEELRSLFEEHGPVLKVLMPPSGTIAIIQFTQANHAKAAFGSLAYRRIKDSVLFLEKAPKDLFRGDVTALTPQVSDRPVGHQKPNVDDLLSRGDTTDEVVETTSLFVRNLNFDTTTSRLAEAFESLDGFVSARVKTKTDPQKPGQVLSMGFGFVEFLNKSQAQDALKVMDGYVLDGHTLGVKASHRGLDAAEERKRDDKAKKAAGQRTKIIIKNLPFQATRKDIRALFGTYGQLRSVRVPKKADYTSRGFAFADFVTPREAENALNSLRDTHLLGRKLVLDFAEAEALDAEEEIEKMQRKVGGQVNKMALQQLVGRGRQKINIGDNDEEEGFDG